MNCQESDVGVSTSPMRCQLHMYGCTNLFPRDQLKEHYLGEAHMKSIITFICSQRVNHESALIDPVINPRDIGELVPSAALRKYSQFIEGLTCLVVETYRLSDSADAASNTLPPMKLTLVSIYTLIRNLFQQTDRDPNHNSNHQLLQDQHQLNEIRMNQIQSLFDPSFGTDGTYYQAERVEQHGDPPPINAHINIPSFVSSNGTLIWKIDDISRKIDDAISTKQTFIDSLWFQTSKNGHRLRARLYLNGKTDRRFISFHIHSTSSINNPFLGHIKFILVDRSTNHPLQHIIKRCNVTEATASCWFGFNDFIDKNMLHAEANPYIRDDSVYFLVCVEQINHQQFANLEPNIKNALLQSYQM